MYQGPTLTSKAEEIADKNYEQALTEATRLKKINSLLSEIATLAD